MIPQVDLDLGAGASVSEDTTGYCATGSLSSSSRNNLPAACCRAISEWELSLCVASGYRCYQSSTTHPHACTCGLTPATNLYSAGTSRACVSWQTNKANSRFDGEEMGKWESERSFTIIPTLDVLAERWFSLLRSEMELNIHPTEFLSPFLCKAAAISHLSLAGLWY